MIARDHTKDRFEIWSNRISIKRTRSRKNGFLSRCSWNGHRGRWDCSKHCKMEEDKQFNNQLCASESKFAFADFIPLRGCFDCHHLLLYVLIYFPRPFQLPHRVLFAIPLTETLSFHRPRPRFVPFLPLSDPPWPKKFLTQLAAPSPPPLCCKILNERI